MSDFRMPKLGADMDEGTLLQWKVAPGELVKKGDIVAEVETAKGVIDIEIFEDATIESLLVEPDTVVPVGAVIAQVQTSDATPGVALNELLSTSISEPSATVARAATSSPATTGTSTSGTSTAVAPTPVSVSDAKISPRARKLAERLQVDLRTITGTGPNGSIIAADIQTAATAQPTETTAVQKSAAAGRKVESGSQFTTTSMRNTIAAAMSRSKREIPHYYLGHDVDVTDLITFVESWNESKTVAERILPALLYYKAIGQAATEFESMNGFYSDGVYHPESAINLGIVISLRGGGLMAPCLLDVPHKDAVTLMAELRDLVTRTRRGGLKASELSQGTLTISSLGDRGVDSIAGVIYPPQVALVGIGSVRERPWVVNGELKARRVLNLSLAADHRVSDGHTGALFLIRIVELLNDPAALM